MRAKVVLGAVVVLLVALVALRVAGFGTLHVILPYHSGGAALPSDPSLIWCGTNKEPGPCTMPPGASNGDHLSSPVPCHAGPDQVADCIPTAKP